ncbi:MAG: transglycosylase SLT domain-containing protein [Fibrobacteres bacterium]|nr:transglycosylase SLT domain-containing protein [Fibrobacterota bacterium]
MAKPAQIVSAIIQVETGGNCDAIGASGERGCMQFLPSTWRLFSIDIYGEVREQTPVRERYVAYKMIERWLEEGLNAAQIAAKWNSGSPHNWQNKKGTNKHGVAYDVPQYVRNVLAQLN